MNGAATVSAALSGAAKSPSSKIMLGLLEYMQYLSINLPSFVKFIYYNKFNIKEFLKSRKNHFSFFSYPSLFPLPSPRFLH